MRARIDVKWAPIRLLSFFSINNCHPGGDGSSESQVGALTCCIWQNAKYRKRQIETHRGTESFEQISTKLGMADYIRGPHSTWQPLWG